MELRARRQALGLTQASLAAALGVTPNTVARWERGEQRVGNPERVSASLGRIERGARRHVRQRARRVAVPPDAISDQTPTERRHNLPIQLTSFVGREQELTEVQSLLGVNRLLTLAGPAGVGKTRLALQLATRLVTEFRDGVWFVELASLGDSAQVSQAVAAVLDIPEEHGRPLVERLKSFVATRRLLLVLDNCEHLLQACASLADTLLRAGAEIRIVATSREPLCTGAEMVWRVAPLAMPNAGQRVSLAEVQGSEAVSLFVQRARSTQPTFSATDENASSILELCRRLDGLPLAIELAAGCVAFLSPAQILTRLEDHFPLLANGSRTAPPRQQSLVAAIEWSYDLLTDAERRVFARLSTFAGSFTLEAAEAVCAADDIRSTDVLDLVRRLVSKSLLIAEPAPGGLIRYRLLETLRAFGRQILHTSGEMETFQQRHAAFHLNLANRSLEEGAPASWAARLTRELDNLDAALRWFIEQGNVESAQLIGAALSNVWRQRAMVGEGRQIMERLLRLPGGDVPTRGRTALLAAAGYLAIYQSDFGRARELLAECLDVLQPLGYRRELAQARAWMTNLELASGHFDAAMVHLEEGLRVARALGDAAQEGILSVYLAELMMCRGDDRAAEAVLHKTLPELREQRATRMVARSLQLLAQAYARRGQYSESRVLLEESLSTWNAVRGHQGAAWSRLDLGQLALMEGVYDAAASHFTEALRSCCELGEQWGIAQCLEAFATLAVKVGHPEDAAKLAGAAAGLRESAMVAPATRQPAGLPDALASARQLLGGSRYATAWEVGRTMSADQGVHLARQVGRANSLSHLTPREREVVSLVALGWTNRQIAERLVIDVRTAETHISNMLSKLGLSGRAQLAIWAVGGQPNAPVESAFS